MLVAVQDLSECRENLENALGDSRSRYFPVAYIAREFGKPYENVLPQVDQESSGCGIDAFHLDEKKGNLYLYHFTWSEDHHHMEIPLKHLINSGMDMIFDEQRPGVRLSQFILRLKKTILENQSVIGRIFVNFISNAKTKDAEKSIVLENYREELESKKFLIDRLFNSKKITFCFQFISNRDKSLSGISHTRKTHTYNISISSTLETDTKNGEKMFITLMPVMDLYRIYRDMDYRFFERNIRSGLSADKPPNKEIRKSLKEIVIDKTMPADHFVFNHNGVTISTEKIEINGNKALVTEPRLLNGAQTVTSLAAFISRSEGNETFNKNKSMLTKIRVMVKFIYADADDFITNVTICNNRQNPVAAWNLRSNDIMQLKLQDKFREELGIYYERQENAFEELSEAVLEEMGIDQGKTLQVKRMAKTFLAIQGEVDRMYRLSEVFNSSKLYNHTFKSGYLKKDSHMILALYKIQFRLGRIAKELLLEEPEKLYFARNGRNLLWALMIQTLLNSSTRKFSEFCDKYGTYLGIENSFTEELIELAAKKLKPILLRASREEPYKKLIADEKHTFVYSRKFYNMCMEKAFDLYTWDKKAI